MVGKVYIYYISGVGCVFLSVSNKTPLVIIIIITGKLYKMDDDQSVCDDICVKILQLAS